MKLIENWKSAWKFLSVHAILALGLLPTVWFELPAEWKAEFPSSWMRIIAVVVMVIGIVGRLKVQPSTAVTSTTDTNPQDPPSLK